MRTRNHQIEEGWDFEDINGVVRRLAAAGWLTGTNVVGPGISVLHFSEKGKWAMGELGKIVVPHISECELPCRTLKPDPVDYPKMLSVVWSAAPELITRPLTYREGLAFISLVLMLALKNQGGGKRF